MRRSPVLQTANARVTSAGRVLDLLRVAGTLSRVEIADATGLTAATITNVVRVLMDAGLVGEVGTEQQSRGQPRRILRLEPTAWYTIGIQVDRATTTIVATDFTGEVVASTGLRGAGTRGPASTIEDLTHHVADLLTTARIPAERVLGVGLVTHGPQDRASGALRTDQPTAEWRGYPLTSTLSKALGIPVLLENDALAAAVGEQWSGGLPTDDFALIYIGSGVGGAVIMGGEPYRGRSSNAVEIGHVSITGSDAPCSCGKTGCVEVIAGPVSVVARVRQDEELARTLGLTGDPAEALVDFERIARAWRDGDERVSGVLEESAHVIGQAALVLADLFDVDTVVLAGPALPTAGPLYRDAVERALQESILQSPAHRPRAVLPADVGTAAAVGAALHVLRTIPVADAPARTDRKTPIPPRGAS